MSPIRIACSIEPRCFAHSHAIDLASCRCSLSSLVLSKPEGMYTEPTMSDALGNSNTAHTSRPSHRAFDDRLRGASLLLINSPTPACAAGDQTSSYPASRAIADSPDTTPISCTASTSSCFEDANERREDMREARPCPMLREAIDKLLSLELLCGGCRVC